MSRRIKYILYLAPFIGVTVLFLFMLLAKSNKYQAFEIVYPSRNYQFDVVGSGHVRLEYQIHGFLDDSAQIDLQTESGADYGRWIIKDTVHIDQQMDFYEGSTPVIITYKPIRAKKGKLVIIARTI